MNALEKIVKKAFEGKKLTKIELAIHWVWNETGTKMGIAYEAAAELAALREAGEKMARMLKYVNDMNKQKEIDLNDDWLWAQNSDTGKKILTALAEWKAANK